MTNLFNSIRIEIETALQGLVAAGDLPAGIDTSKVAAEPPRDPSHGDVATNAAMVLAREAGRKPRDLAAMLAPRLEGIEGVTAVEIAGPGFINMRLGDAFWRDRLREILRAGTAYGESEAGGGRKVNVEYVSANPTGPLHIGHGRGAVFGDALANLLAKAGFDVTREYYVNDAGAQVDMLARSAHHRYLEALGEPVGDIPEGLYPGDYMKAVGEKLAADVGDRWRGRPESEWLEPIRETAIAMMLASIRDDLEAVGIRQEIFTSERAVVAAGGIERAVAALEAQELIYTGVLEPPKGKLPDDWEPRPQMLFRSSAFGDDVDRPLRKSDGSWTYFASDIAYHFDKVQRGFEVLIDVWGADHGGYVKRVDAAVRALTGKAALDVKLCQLVRVMRAGELVRMSKRAGDFVTLREVVDEVGKDVVRFIMLTRKNDAPLDFDLARVLEQSRDNPIFYVQYAHARVCSVMRHARDLFPGVPLADAALAERNLDLLTDRDEIGLVKAMAAWPRLVEGAAEAHEPHRVAFFLYDLASQFHALWTRGRDESRMRFILDDEPALTFARIALIRALATVLASGLEVFGVAPLEEMR